MPVGVNVSASVLCVRTCVYVCHRGYLFVSACKEESEVCVCVCVCVCVTTSERVTVCVCVTISVCVCVCVCVCVHVSIAAADVGHYPFLLPGAMQQERTEGEGMDGGVWGQGGMGKKEGGRVGG